MKVRPVDPTDVSTVRKKALQYLARRDHCSNELRTKLTQRGFDSQTVAAVTTALQQEKLLDERTYIEHFISYQAGRGKGPDHIGRKLRALGLDPQLVGRLLEEGQNWCDQAQLVRRKKFGSVLPTVRLDSLKQAQFLRYRGFTNAQIRQALEANADIDVTE